MSDHNPLIAERIVIPITGVQPTAVTGETVTIPAGSAGAVVDAYVERKPILKGTRDYVGGFGNSSLVLTSATFTTEVSSSTPDADLTNGQYWVDYITGRIHGKKANTSTSMTAAYYVFQAVGSGGSSSGTPRDNNVFTNTDWVASGGITTITLPSTPISGSVAVYLNGRRELPVAYDALGYTISGSNITFPFEFESSYVAIIDYRE